MPFARLPAALGLALIGTFSVLLHRHAGLMPPFLVRLGDGAPDLCPSLDRAPGSVFHAAQTCEELPSALPEFRAELCRAPAFDSGAFTVRISRTDPRACEAALVSNLQAADAEEPWETWLQTERGPDGFFLRVDGAQRFATERAVHEGACSYRFDVVLQNPGRVYLTGAHYYEDYNAYNERNATWAEMLDRPLFPRPIEFDVGSPVCPAYKPPQLDPARATFSPDIPSRVSDLSPPPFDAAYPSCEGDDPISGAYVPHNPLDALYPPVPYPVGHKGPVHGRYRFVPRGCRFRHAGLRYGDPSLCTERAGRVLVMGDSHGRVAYDAMVHRLSGATEMMLRSEKVRDKNATLGALGLNFVWDPLLSSAAPSCVELTTLLEGVDVFVVSAGAHWRSTAKFLSDLSHFFETMSDCPLAPPPKHRIFLTTPAVAPRQDEYVRMHKEKRTSTRQDYLAMRSRELARMYGWKVVDQFALTEPHTVELMSLDRAHYVATDAIDPIVDELLQKAGVCDDM
ncbi:hypothetical protein HDZ31DRAFT_39231 [Schizophyllum fasciatum]